MPLLFGLRLGPLRFCCGFSKTAEHQSNARSDHSQHQKEMACFCIHHKLNTAEDLNDNDR